MKNPTPPIELLQAREVLDERRVLSMLKALNHSVDQWSNVHMPAGGLGATARWQIIHNHFYQHCAEELAWDDNCRFYDSHNQQALIFDEKLLIRCKKFDKRLRTANYQTTTAKDFVHAERQIALDDDMSGLHRLHFGYHLNIVTTATAGAFLTSPKGDPEEFNYWVWQVLGNPKDSSLMQEQGRIDSENGPVLPDRHLTYLYEDYSHRLG